ncbi:Hypothetical predicted protein [Mytilus galloprovincialis]|uniref:DDE Tnp4 domain-containing protein n=1 Tax=Mytilus galloprovincialis TaxID=29158 RepID=A0A8B6DDV7_MYTGA|nr:Hypothetical predicted protein [Mytilus galloprovincialis]
MAAFLRKMCILEMFDDEDEDIHRLLAKRSINTLSVINMTTRRSFMPKVTDYMAVVGQMAVPQHIDDFKMHYRISRDVFHIILESVQDLLIRGGRGPHDTVTPEKQLLVCFSYLATNQSMRETAHFFNLSKSTVHQIIKEVCNILVNLRDRIIRWPSPRQQTEIATEVEAVCSLPGVTGFIDGTHIRLSAAIGGERDYYNRKGYPSIQLQAVVDNNMKIINAYTGWPGCVHDARVLRNSSVYIKAEAGELFSQNYHIFGDNAYPLRNWLVTPFKNFGNLTRQQIKFNKRLSGVRQTVERAFGHLKGRFRRLRDVPLHDHKEVCNLIIACCVLHNLCIINEDDVEGYIEYEEEDPNNFPNVYQNGHAGVLRRLQLVNIP